MKSAVYKMSYTEGVAFIATMATMDGKKDIHFSIEKQEWIGTPEETNAIKEFLKKTKSKNN